MIAACVACQAANRDAPVEHTSRRFDGRNRLISAPSPVVAASSPPASIGLHYQKRVDGSVWP